ncbi:MAG: DeoR/GlpR transcriptional regulator [Erysipelotrichaceae bacterium]|nr:DeoR/GlpR transcriptional regulator [Erysipelotrichaceae bacterium]
MKVDYATVQKRRDDIMMLIQKLGEVTVEQLVNDFNVSNITIRRDLQYWEDRGAIIRFHGGAKIVQHMVNHNNTYFSNDRYKHAIAKYASNFVKEGDTVFINTSSTAILVLQYIKKRCTVITNNAKAVLMEHAPEVSIILTGGELRFPKEAMIGDIVLNNLSRVTADICFLGCSGISAQYGITTAIHAETAVNEAMLNKTIGQKFILADYTKVGATYSFTSGYVDEIDYLITDINANAEEIQRIKKKGVKTVLLEPIIEKAK